MIDFKKLNPIINESLKEKEDYNIWIKKAKNILPNFPENLLKDYVYRHFDKFENDAINLHLNYLDFNIKLIKNINENDIYSVYEENIKYPWYKIDIINKIVYKGTEKRIIKNQLTDYILEYNEIYSPLVLITFKNQDKYFKEKYLLVDGHNRFSMYKVIKKENSKIKKLEVYILEEIIEEKQ